MSIRVAEWVLLSEVRRSDWVCDPTSGQPGLVSEVTLDGERVIVRFRIGPPGRLGYIGMAGDQACRLVRKRGQKDGR